MDSDNALFLRGKPLGIKNGFGYALLLANLAPILKAFSQSFGNSSFRLFAFSSELNAVTTYLDPN
jgi:hypothetical protein